MRKTDLTKDQPLFWNRILHKRLDRNDMAEAVRTHRLVDYATLYLDAGDLVRRLITPATLTRDGGER
jgi:hypothetical protein